MRRFEEAPFNNSVFNSSADENIVNAWKESSEIFANYSDFYKKDQKNGKY